MKLAIMMAIYLATEILGLAILYGLLRRSIDPDNKHPLAAALPAAAVGILLLFPLIGALIPDGPLCWFFQKWGNIFIGYLIYFFGTLLIVRIIEFVIRLVHRIRTGSRREIPRKAYVIMLSSVLALAVVLNVGGMAAVYLLVPLIDSLLSHVNTKALAAVCIILLAAFSYDMVYSHHHPNIGEGITDYDAYKSSASVEYIVSDTRDTAPETYRLLA